MNIASSAGPSFSTQTTRLSIDRRWRQTQMRFQAATQRHRAAANLPVSIGFAQHASSISARSSNGKSWRRTQRRGRMPAPSRIRVRPATDSTRDSALEGSLPEPRIRRVGVRQAQARMGTRPAPRGRDQARPAARRSCDPCARMDRRLRAACARSSAHDPLGGRRRAIPARTSETTSRA